MSFHSKHSFCFNAGQCEMAFGELFAAIPDAVVHEGRDGVIMNVNPAFERIFGYKPDEIIGKKTIELFPDPVSPSLPDCLKRVMGKPDRPYERISLRRKNGKVFNALGICTALHNTKGEVDGFLSLLRDNTETERRETESNRLAAAVEKSSDNVIITDSAGSIEYVNPSFERNTGFSRSEVLGKNPSILKSEAHDDEFYKKIWTTINSGRSWCGRIKNRRKCGSFIIEDCSISPVISESGDIVNFVGVKKDVTRAIELEAHLRHSGKVEPQGCRASGVIHDINNLLFPLILYAENLLDEMPEKCAYRDALVEILKSGFKIRDMVSGILESGRRQKLNMVSLNLNEVIIDFKNLLRKTIRDDVEIDFRLDPQLPAVLGDEAQICQVVMNLAVNAQNAMPDGGCLTVQTGTCPVSCFTGCRDNNCNCPTLVFIQVSDTGQGMDDDIINHIFEPFFTTGGAGQGSGLGLASVQGIVKQHNGHIDVKSNPGTGSCFSVGLPVHKSSRQHAVQRRLSA